MDELQITQVGAIGKAYLLGLLTAAFIFITPAVISCFIDDCVVPERFIPIVYDT